MSLNRLYRTSEGWLLQSAAGWRRPGSAQIQDLFVGRSSVNAFLALSFPPAEALDPRAATLAPLLDHEIWAAGVTYRRSREARIDESAVASVYDRVYDAPRPQIFFKACPHKAVGSGGVIGIRDDSKWTVPEPELTLVADPRGRLIGYTIGDDVSARDIEGPNPLYQPQAKVYRGSCAIGPALLLQDGTHDPLEWQIRMTITRHGAQIFEGSSALSQLKRRPEELLAALHRCQDLPGGSALLTGTGIVPPDEFALADGDHVAISIDAIGTLLSTARALAA